jgi:tight adherence protein C
VSNKGIKHMDPLFIIAILVFSLMLLLGWGAYAFYQSRQQTSEWGARVKGESSKPSQGKASETTSHTVRQSLVSLLERLGQASKPKDQIQVSRIREKLVNAGYRNSRAPIIFFGSRLFLAVLFGLSFLIFGTEATQNMSSPYAFPGILILCMVVGFYGPQLWLSSAISSRKERLVDGFPDALDLMVVCVEAGLGLDQAMNRVGQEIIMGHKDLGEEFGLLNLELRAGLSREQALRNLVQRTDLEDIRSLVALLIQTDRFGTSIGQALRVHSDSMRMNRRMKAEEKAAQLAVKLMIPLILFIFPSLMVVIAGPGAIRLMNNFANF